MTGTVFLACIAPAQAATFQITTAADSGSGSLRQAILDANAKPDADSIIFASSLTGTLVLSGGEIVINGDLTIEGALANRITLSGGGTQRLFNITKGTVNFKNLTLSNGFVQGSAAESRSGKPGGDIGGGAIFNAGVLTLSNVTLSKNTAVGGTGGSGPTVRNFGTVSQIRGGTGGSARGGAILNAGTLNLIQTHFEGNQAVGGKGGAGGVVYDTQTGRPTKYGEGGHGGNAYGGAVYNGGLLTSDNTSPSGTTSAPNQALGGEGGNWGGRGTSIADSGTGYSNDIRDVAPIANPLVITGAQERAISAQLPATGDTLTYSIVSGTLPAGLTLDAATGIISGASPAVVKGLTLTYRVTDGYRTSAPATITFNLVASDPKSLVVDTTSDALDNLDGKNTLREAVAYANTLVSPSTITFANGVQGTIVLTNGALQLTKDVTIAGPTDRAIVVDGNLQDRVFYIQSGTTDLSNLTIQRGIGGGLTNTVSGHLNLENCTVSNNVPQTNGTAVYGRGGGLYNSGTAKLVNCTFAGNVEMLNNGGGIYNSGNLSLESCTLAGNSSSYRGGGIYNIGDLTLNNNLLSGNKLLIDSSVSGGSDLYGTTTEANYNLVTDIAGGSLRGIGNILGQDARLGPLQNNGGPTSTFELLAKSPAIDTGQSDLATDQRGLPRRTGKGVDIGAYELQGVTFGISSLTLLPESPKTKDILKIRVLTRNATPKATYNYLWKKNDQVVRSTQASKSSQDRLDLSLADNGDKGDTITVEVTVNDPGTQERIVSQSASVIVQNSTPILNEVKLSPGAPTSLQTVRAIFRGGDDDSADTIAPLCKWRIGELVLSQEKGTSLDLSQYPTVKAGDVISLEARLTDGSAVSKTIKTSVTVAAANQGRVSNQLKIEGIAPTPSAPAS